jgi:hypothetical protein
VKKDIIIRLEIELITEPVSDVESLVVLLGYCGVEVAMTLIHVHGSFIHPHLLPPNVKLTYSLFLNIAPATSGPF